MATSQAELWHIIEQTAPRASWVSLQRIYSLIEQHSILSPDDFEPDAPGSDSPRWQRNVRNVLQYRKQTEILWSGSAEYYIPPAIGDPGELATGELSLRQRLWDQLLQAGGPSGVSPQLLRGLRIAGGAQGIWVDKQRTQVLTPEGHGVTVSLLHTGRHYPDDLAEDGMIYHYPTTSRPPERDANEIGATKALADFQLPVFVITANASSHALRDVRRAWLAAYDDPSAQFLISFQDEPPPPPAPPPLETEPFQALHLRDRRPRAGSSLSRRATFRFEVFRRYGAQCAVCGIRLLQALDAVHIIPVQQHGADDARNGLPLCATHHRAFDADAFQIEPGSHRVVTRAPFGPEHLRITKADVLHLPHLPHTDALTWRWVRRPQGD